MKPKEQVPGQKADKKEDLPASSFSGRSIKRKVILEKEDRSAVLPPEELVPRPHKSGRPITKRVTRAKKVSAENIKKEETDAGKVAAQIAIRILSEDVEGRALLKEAGIAAFRLTQNLTGQLPSASSALKTQYASLVSTFSKGGADLVRLRLQEINDGLKGESQAPFEPGEEEKWRPLPSSPLVVPSPPVEAPLSLKSTSSPVQAPLIEADEASKGAGPFAQEEVVDAFISDVPHWDLIEDGAAEAAMAAGIRAALVSKGENKDKKSPQTVARKTSGRVVQRLRSFL